MVQREHFYTAEFLETSGIEPFKEHVVQYFAGERTVPVSRTHAYDHHDVFFTFNEPLLQLFLEQPDSISKPYVVALKYGFMGYSTGGRNGIFLLQKSDGGLIEAVNRLAVKYKNTVRKDLDLRESELDALRKVKIVWHEKSGKRVVGVYNTSNDRMLFLDFAQY